MKAIEEEIEEEITRDCKTCKKRFRNLIDGEDYCDITEEKIGSGEEYCNLILTN